MSAVEKNTKVTREAYLAYLDASDHKAEFLDGVIYDMAGGTLVHGQIAANFIGAMFGMLRTQPCRVYTSDVKVEIAEDGSIVFPDFTVACGESMHPLDRKDILTNPVLVGEVLSPDRAGYDRGGKFMKYMTITSLREYVLVEQTHAQVDVFYRTDSGLWDIHSYDALDQSVHLQSLGIHVPMQDIYRDVVFEG